VNAIWTVPVTVRPGQCQNRNFRAPNNGDDIPATNRAGFNGSIQDSAEYLEKPGERMFEDRGPVDGKKLAGHSTCHVSEDWNGDNIPEPSRNTRRVRRPESP
jgi:hypothetical protein